MSCIKNSLVKKNLHGARLTPQGGGPTSALALVQRVGRSALEGEKTFGAGDLVGAPRLLTQPRARGDTWPPAIVWVVRLHGRWCESRPGMTRSRAINVARYLVIFEYSCGLGGETYIGK